MAIQLSKTLPNGVTGNYWKVNLSGLGSPDGSVGAYMSLYLNQAARDAGLKPIYSVKIPITLTNGALRAALASAPFRDAIGLAYDQVIAVTTGAAQYPDFSLGTVV